jgi:hypothetical protein
VADGTRARSHAGWAILAGERKIMKRRISALLGACAVMVGCGRTPLAPEAPAPATAAVAMVSATTSIDLSDERLLDLATALADARQRLLPAVSGEETGISAEALGGALDRLSGSLVDEDAAGMMSAADEAERVIAALSPEQSESLGPELDAIRLTLAELRESAVPTEMSPE